MSVLPSLLTVSTTLPSHSSSMQMCTQKMLQVTATVTLLCCEKLTKPAARLRITPLYKSPGLGFVQVKRLMEMRLTEVGTVILQRNPTLSHSLFSRT